VKYLGTYLNDHLAGSTVGMRVARRAAKENEGSDYGPVLERLAAEIDEDRATLQDLMKQLKVRRDPVKALTPAVAETLGRLKLNDELTSYSPLSRLEELELLSLGVEGKLALWRALRPHVDAAVDYDELIARATSQRRRLERLRVKAAAETFAGR
jgi:hypothetical protein